MADKSISEQKSEGIREVFAQLREEHREPSSVEMDKIIDIDAFYSQLYACMGQELDKKLLNDTTWWMTNIMYQKIDMDDKEMALRCRAYAIAVCISADRFESVLSAFSMLGNYLHKSKRWSDQIAHKDVYDAISAQFIHESREMSDQAGGFEEYLKKEKMKVSPKILKLSEGLIEYMERYYHDLVSSADAAEMTQPQFEKSQSQQSEAAQREEVGYDTDGTAHKSVEKKKKIMVFGLITGIVLTAAALMFFISVIAGKIKTDLSHQADQSTPRTSAPEVPGQTDQSSKEQERLQETEETASEKTTTDSEPGSTGAGDTGLVMLDTIEKNVRINTEAVLYEDPKCAESVVDDTYADITLPAGTKVEVTGYNQNVCMINCTDPAGKEYTGVYVERGNLDIELP